MALRMADDDARSRLKNLAQGVREKVQPTGRLQLDQKGTAMLAQLVRDLTGPDGMPGLYVAQNTPTQVRLRRPSKAGQLILGWDKATGALGVTYEKFNARPRHVRYLLNEADDSWHSMEDGREIYDELTASLVDILYPEGR